jgi:zinc/manganese transport system ATP-binding protein
MINLHNLTISYRHHPALHHISGRFEKGSLTAVIGPNGAGKSTLLKSLVGMVPIASGALQVDATRERIAYLPQASEIDRSFPINVHDCVMLGTWSTAGPWRSISGALREQVDAAITTVGLQGFEKRPVGTLSNGQLQRVMFARLLVQDADLILLDEPFNAVDSRTTQSLLQLVRQWHDQNRTVIAVVHDDSQVREFFPDALLLAREVVAWGKTPSVLSELNTRRARSMAEAWDDRAEECHVDEAPLHKAVSP